MAPARVDDTSAAQSSHRQGTRRATPEGRKLEQPDTRLSTSRSMIRRERGTRNQGPPRFGCTKVARIRRGGSLKAVARPADVDHVGFRVAMPVFAAAFAVDLLSKTWVVQHSQHVVFNARSTDLPRRLVMSAVAIAVAVVLTRLARWRGLGRVWGLWVGFALLVAGVLANGVSPYLWSRGVPDFIHVSGGWAWNVADFEIAVGMTGGILSIAVGAVFVYLREALGRLHPAG